MHHLVGYFFNQVQEQEDVIEGVYFFGLRLAVMLEDRVAKDQLVCHDLMELVQNERENRQLHFVDILNRDFEQLVNKVIVLEILQQDFIDQLLDLLIYFSFHQLHKRKWFFFLLAFRGVSGLFLIVLVLTEITLQQFDY